VNSLRSVLVTGYWFTPFGRELASLGSGYWLLVNSLRSVRVSGIRHKVSGATEYRIPNTDYRILVTGFSYPLLLYRFTVNADNYHLQRYFSCGLFSSGLYQAKQSAATGYLHHNYCHSIDFGIIDKRGYFADVYLHIAVEFRAGNGNGFTFKIFAVEISSSEGNTVGCDNYIGALK
jgi:hypothetical protein